MSTTETPAEVLTLVKAWLTEIPAPVRLAIFALTFLAGIGIGSTQIAYAILGLTQPVWLTVAIAVLVPISGAIAGTASVNVITSPAGFLPTAFRQPFYIAVTLAAWVWSIVLLALVAAGVSTAAWVIVVTAVIGYLGSIGTSVVAGVSLWGQQ